jgi:hypothetical protein
MWAEDGTVFLGEHLIYGGADSVFRVYAGYLHVVPRLTVSVVASVAPVTHWAVGITAAFSLIVGLISAAVYSAAAALVPEPATRAALSLAAALLPIAPVEVLGNVANLHWYFIWAVFWLLLARPRTWWGSACLGLVTLLCALTEIQVMALLPLGVLQLRHRRAWPIFAGVLIGGAAQVFATVASPRSPNLNPPLSPVSIAEGYLVQGVMTLYDAQGPTIGRVILEHGWWIALALFTPFGIALAYLVTRGRWGERVLATSLFGYSIAYWCAALILNPQPNFDYRFYGPEDMRSLFLMRYGFIPSLFLLAIAILAIGRLWREGRVGAVLARLGAAGLLVGLGLNFQPEFSWRSAGPTWSHSLAVAQRSCYGGPNDVVLPITPEGWTVTLSCDLVAGRLP